MPHAPNLRLYRQRPLRPEQQAPPRPARTLTVHSAGDAVSIEWRAGDIPHVVAVRRAG